MYQNRVESTKFIPSFTFSIDCKWDGLESLLSNYGPPGLMFESLELDYQYSIFRNKTLQKTQQ